MIRRSAGFSEVFRDVDELDAAGQLPIGSALMLLRAVRNASAQGQADARRAVVITVWWILLGGSRRWMRWWS